MQNQTEQSKLNSNTHRTISGQLAEWGIEFSQDRVAQLSINQQRQLQDWINKGVDADGTYQAEFASLPEFMENELLEMSGEVSAEPQEFIVEQAINAYEAEIPITNNPYLFDTTAWHLWRKAYSHWHHGESLDFTNESISNSQEGDHCHSITDITQQLTRLFPQLNQTEHSLKKLHHKKKKMKRQRKAFIQQQSQLIHQLCKSIRSKTDTFAVYPQEEKLSQKMESESESTIEASPSHTIQENQRTSQASDSDGPIQLVRIPLTPPETNRVEVYLQQNSDGHWRAGHLWSVITNSQTKQLSRGSRQPDQQQMAYPSEAAALLNEVIYLSQGIIGVVEIESQILDYLNLLEEYPGQLSVCSECHSHYLPDNDSHVELCAQCFSASND
ncbi:hypothetical protein [Gimesia aquarii]|uniref:Uncharacterized protein n=1 Tax=Gimesia aquarii TaxID=2527964 RepID=A0A517VP19_9PLAN|nr:hypothetical protein [Gimesia aquarii]QDT94766.1 hypothetical protein V144x_01970 [Gimesia aquarii]